MKTYLKSIYHIVLLAALILGFGASVSAQKKVKKTELSTKDQIRFDRLYIDASKAKILSDFEQAIKLYEASVKIDPNQAAPYYELGGLYMNFGEVEEAIENSSKAIELDPTNFYYRLLRAEIYKNDQQIKNAINDFEGILQDFPDKYSIYVDLALLYVMNKNLQGAIDAYNKLEEEIGDNEEIKLKKQYLYLQMGEVKKAALEIEDIIEMQPDRVEFYLLLAEVYYVNGYNDKAQMAYKKAEARFPDDANVHLSMAEFYKSRKEYDKALNHLKVAFKDPTLDVDMEIQSILSFFDLIEINDKYTKDIAELGQILLKAHPKDARVLTINGDITMNLGDLKGARGYFLKAVEIDDSRFPIWSQLLILEADLEMLDTLLLHCNQAIELFPNQPICYYFSGYANGRLNNHEAAAESYKRGLTLVYGNDALKMQFYLGMAESYNEVNNYEESDKAFDAVLKMDSNNTVALNNYSYYLSVRGERLEEALRMSAKSNKLEPNQPTYLDTYAWIFYKLARYEDARIWMEKALKNGGGNSDVILEHMGDVLYQLNEKDMALEYWKKARLAGKGSEFLDKKLKEGVLYE